MIINIVLYGAYDRYNYGDNLMPILFEMYMEKYHSGLLHECNLVFASISSSDLTKYGCKATTSIKSLVDSLESGSFVIPIGGEVLCAKNSELYMHMHTPGLKAKLLNIIKSNFGKLFDLYSGLIYKAPWEYPYIPGKNQFSNDVDIMYNTVGGGIRHLDCTAMQLVTERLNTAKFLSVRDKRTHDNIFPDVDSVVSPDSVFIVSDLISDEFLSKMVRESIVNCCNGDYLAFQAAPSKMNETISEVTLNTENISRLNGGKVVLLPIGYASGHDDYLYLSKISDNLNVECELLYELNIWEILYVIKNSDLFVGTSLHGIITAMAYGVPHFGLNNKLHKVDAFLRDWSIAPFNGCMKTIEVMNILTSTPEFEKEKLKENAIKLAQLVRDNNEKIIDLIR